MIHSLEAEQHVIGGIMLANDLHAVSSIVSEGDFYRNEHRLIFASMSRLSDRQEPLDSLSICEDLSSHKELDSAGGRSYLADLVTSIPGVANLESYARIVRDKSLERGILAKCSAIIEFTSEAGSAEEKIAKAQASLAELESPAPDLNEFMDFQHWLGRGSNELMSCLLYTSPSPRDRQKSRMPSSA